MSGNIQALSTIWAGLTGTTEQKLVALNNTQVPGPPVDVAQSLVQVVCARNGLLATLPSYANSPPAGAIPQAVVAAQYLVVILTDPNQKTITTSQAPVLSAVQSLLEALVSDPLSGVQQSVANQLMALVQPLVPWWQVNGFSGPVGVLDLISAGYLT